MKKEKIKVPFKTFPAGGKRFGFAPRTKKTAPDAANIKSGKAELVNTHVSASILPDEQEDCKG